MIDAAAVLFDLDGTLVDTAPEFIVALNHLRAELGLAAVAAARIRPVVSKGGAAMVRAAFADLPDAEHGALLERFLALYRRDLGSATVFFPGVVDLLAALEARGTPWAIVTNKPSWLTGPLLDVLQLSARAACVVCGDTLAVKKPDPEPILHVCTALGVAPSHTLMVGDDERDVIAARAAGAIAVLADWGYAEDAGADAWGAVHRAATPAALGKLLGVDVVVPGATA